MSIIQYPVYGALQFMSLARCSRAGCVAFFFSQTSFVLFSLSRFRGLSVLDLIWCLMFRSSFCVHGCVPFCGYMYVLVCVCFSVRISVHCLWCAYLCAHGVLLFWVSYPFICGRTLPVACPGWPLRLCLAGFIGSLTEHRTPFLGVLLMLPGMCVSPGWALVCLQHLSCTAYSVRRCSLLAFSLVGEVLLSDLVLSGSAV